MISTNRIDFLRELDEIVAINIDCVHLMGSFRDFRNSKFYDELIPKHQCCEFQRKNSIESNVSI